MKMVETYILILHFYLLRFFIFNFSTLLLSLLCLNFSTSITMKSLFVLSGVIASTLALTLRQHQGLTICQTLNSSPSPEVLDYIGSTTTQFNTTCVCNYLKVLEHANKFLIRMYFSMVIPRTAVTGRLRCGTPCWISTPASRYAWRMRLRETSDRATTEGMITLFSSHSRYIYKRL